LSTRGIKFIGLFILVVVDITLFIVAYFLFELDWLINNVLYDYGLRYDDTWFAFEQLAAKASLGLLAFAIVATAVTGVAYYRTAKEQEAHKTVLICKSCGNALTRINGEVTIEESTPRFHILKTCPFCNEQLFDTSPLPSIVVAHSTTT
jgi:hypothetical protein